MHTRTSDIIRSLSARVGLDVYDQVSLLLEFLDDGAVTSGDVEEFLTRMPWITVPAHIDDDSPSGAYHAYEDVNGWDLYLSVELLADLVDYTEATEAFGDWAAEREIGEA